ncbi:hypothetical protein AB0D42_40985 [Streptomyces sp. NPDC048304]|uniref:hypothetical protein n=1 Tax=Streptomyces sp. NPDC048304 TaxID=3154820 RepID=UPI0034109B06
MADETYQFCKIFVQAAEPQPVAEGLATLLGARLRRWVLELPEAVVEIRKNPDAGATDDFIGWPITVEIDAGPDAADEAIVLLASRILTEFWKRGTAAVAACDYEDELPWGGGQARLE